MRLAEPVDELVRDGIFARVDSADFAARLAHTGADSARDTVVKVQAKLTELAEAWAADAITKAEWDAARGPLTDRLAAAEATLAAGSATRAVDTYVGRPGALRAAWDDLSADRRRAIVATLLRSITILPNPVPGRNTFDPSLVVPDWIY
jgi:hypothetical protein